MKALTGNASRKGLKIQSMPTDQNSGHARFKGHKDFLKGISTPRNRSSKLRDVVHISGEEAKLKIAFVGEAGCAKTSFVHRYLKNEFPRNPPPTVAARFFEKSVIAGRRRVKLRLWDTAGQERYAALTPMCLKGVDGIVVSYDITSRQSFNEARQRYLSLKMEYRHAVIMVVGNKVDLEKWRRDISRDEGEDLTDDLCADLFFEGKLNK